MTLYKLTVVVVGFNWLLDSSLHALLHGNAAVVPPVVCIESFAFVSVSIRTCREDSSPVGQFLISFCFIAILPLLALYRLLRRNCDEMKASKPATLLSCMFTTDG